LAIFTHLIVAMQRMITSWRAELPCGIDGKLGYLNLPWLFITQMHR